VLKRYSLEIVKFGILEQMDKFLIYFFAGFCGGIVRGSVGFVKNKTLEKAIILNYNIF